MVILYLQRLTMEKDTSSHYNTMEWCVQVGSDAETDSEDSDEEQEQEEDDSEMEQAEEVEQAVHSSS